MPEYLANAYFEEPDALIVLVRICGDAPRETGGVTRKKWKTRVQLSFRVFSVFRG
jgi:hypothetical protein